MHNPEIRDLFRFVFDKKLDIVDADNFIPAYGNNLFIQKRFADKNFIFRTADRFGSIRRKFDADLVFEDEPFDACPWNVFWRLTVRRVHN